MQMLEQNMQSISLNISLSSLAAMQYCYSKRNEEKEPNEANGPNTSDEIRKLENSNETADSKRA
jgi:hypothetical protein